MNFSRRLDIIESGFGRLGGWYVEENGERLAALVDVRFADMFWDSYRLEVLTTDPIQRAKLLTAEFWTSDGLAFRSIPFGEVSRRAVPSLSASTTLRATGRIEMRWLRLPVQCQPWDWAAIQLRRLWRSVRSKRQSFAGRS
jgi:hypothetical protein